VLAAGVLWVWMRGEGDDTMVPHYFIS